MGKYDNILKAVLQRWGSSVLRDIIDEPIVGWPNIELQQVTVQYADLLAETPSGRLWHIELQSGNDPEMPVRMLEYAIRVYRRFKRLPSQAVLYVGRDPMRMKHVLRGEGLSFCYRLLDAHSLEPDELLASDSVGDNVMAILTHLRDSPRAVRRILNAISALEDQDRQVAFEALLLLASLRELEETVEREAKKMPVFEDILDHKVLGREYKRGREDGRDEGRQDGELTLIRIQLKERFGEIPRDLDAKLSGLTTTELEQLARRIFRASSFDDVFR
mgnify:CR=1 FL=1